MNNLNLAQKLTLGEMQEIEGGKVASLSCAGAWCVYIGTCATVEVLTAGTGMLIFGAALFVLDAC